MEKKKPNPISYKLPKPYPSISWSELPLDLLNSILDRLGFADYQHAKSVCSSWYTASRQCVPKNQIPWLILFPEDDDNNTSCKLFNPEVKDKLYKTQDLGCDFPKSVCKATYESWLLMQDPLYNLYILNLFTHERIGLPPVEPQLCQRVSLTGYRITNDPEQWESQGIDIRYPVFWIDEETKDYVVLWGLEEWCVVYAQKGDTLWNEIPETSNCYHMVYKDHKLYFLSLFGSFKIFDFSGKTPQHTFECGVIVYRFQVGSHHRHPSNSWHVVFTKLVVRVTGDVLRVEKMLRPASRLLYFRVCKVYSSRVFKKYEQIDSLGYEAMLLDLGITVLANDIEGFKRNYIYFNGSHEENATEIRLFNLETKKMEPLHKFDCSSIQQIASARWFLPSFKRKC